MWGNIQPTLPPWGFQGAIVLIGVIALLAPALFGFYTSLAGRPLLSALLLDD